MSLNRMKNSWTSGLTKIRKRMDSKFFPGDWWCEELFKSHKIMASLLKNDIYESGLALEDIELNMSNENIQKFNKRICEIIGNEYFQTYNFSSGILKKPKLTFKKFDRKRNIEHTVVMSVNKHITHYATKAMKLDADKLQSLAKVLSALAEEWNRQRVRKMEVIAKISILPYDFMRIGHYGADQGSCFNQNGCHIKDKYRLGVGKETYVVTIRKPDVIEEDILVKDGEGKERAIARCFGFRTEDKENNPIFNVCNFYMSNEYTAAVTTAVHHLFEQLTGEKLKVSHDHISMKGVYLNSNSNKTSMSMSVNKVTNTQQLDATHGILK